MAFHKVTYTEQARVATVDPIRSKRDIWRIVQWFRERDLDKYELIFIFGCYTGLRASDIVSFQVKDLYNKNRAVIREVKTGKVKVFELQKQLQERINFYVDKHQLEPDDFIFGGRGDKEIDRSQIYRYMNRACTELHIDANIGTHTLRKTFGYHHYKQFKDVALLQKIFNHASPDVTLIYIGITQEEIDKSMQELDLSYEETPETLEEIALKGNNKTRIKAVLSLCRNYLKFTRNKGIHKPFAEIIIDLIMHTSEYQY